MLLEELPSEVLINVFSYLDEKDLYTLQGLSRRFASLIGDEELWKNLFITRLHTSYFPSFSKSQRYSHEYVARVSGVKQWQHNRLIKTRYNLSPTPLHVTHLRNHPNQVAIEELIFQYPKLACYHDGIITLVQLQSKRSKIKNRMVYIPCTTPQGCSTMHFNINSAVFGRFDGRVFGKLLTNKSYLQPVTEFDSSHSACVTAIATTNSTMIDSTTKDWSVSGSENGEIIWWLETKKYKSLKFANSPILRLSLVNKNITIALDEKSIYVIEDMERVHTLDIPHDPVTNKRISIHFFKIDYGAQTLCLADTQSIYMISFNLTKDFGQVKVLKLKDPTETITNVIMDEETAKREQDPQLAGGDGCFVALCTSNMRILVLNTRKSSFVTVNAEQLYQEVKPLREFQFNDHIYATQITNLVLVLALAGTIEIYDVLSGELIKTVQKTEKIPQFLRVSQGRMIVSSGNTIHYLQYIPDEDDQSESHKKSHGSSRLRSNKWNETLHSEMEMYNEKLKQEEERELENARLMEAYGGDMDGDDEELQLKIALLESQNLNSQSAEGTDDNARADPTTEEEDEALRAAIEESLRMQRLQEEVRTAVSMEDDEEFLRAVEQSSRDDEERRTRRGQRRTLTDLGHNEPTTEETSNVQHGDINDEELQLAIALSLSEINESQ